jgi:hypothetical protein
MHLVLHVSQAAHCLDSSALGGATCSSPGMQPLKRAAGEPDGRHGAGAQAAPCRIRGCSGELLEARGGPGALPLWRCATCGAEVDGRTPDGSGPADVVARAAALWQESRAVLAARVRPQRLPLAVESSGALRAGPGLARPGAPAMRWPGSSLRRTAFVSPMSRTL